MDDLDTRRKHSLEKVRSAWASIISKYGSLPPEKQGDVIDLRSGTIVSDKGHIRSLKQKDNLWAALPEISTSTATSQTSPINTPNTTNVAQSKKIVMYDLTSTPDPTPDQSSYIVTSSQHLTRSKVAGSDNLHVQHIPASLQGSKRGKRLQQADRDLTRDPLNILSSTPPLDTPSKVRRLRKAIDKLYASHPTSVLDRRRHIHSLVVHTRHTQRKHRRTRAGA